MADSNRSVFEVGSFEKGDGGEEGVKVDVEYVAAGKAAVTSFGLG